MKKFVSLLLALLMLGSMVACTGDDTPGTTEDTTDAIHEGDETEGKTAVDEIFDGVKEERFVRPVTASTLYYIVSDKWDAYSNADALLMGTLQGLTAKNSEEQIYLGDESNVAYIRPVTEKMGVTWFETVEGKELTPENLLAYYADKDVYKGYILCTEENRESVFVAVSIAGLLDGVVVTEENKDKLDNLGFECLLDVSDKDDAWLRQSEYWDLLSKNVAVERCYDGSFLSMHRGIPGLIDFAVLNGAYYTLYEGYVEEEHSAHFDYLNDGALLFGWYIPIGEAGVVSSLGKINASIIPADTSRNMSILSGFPVQSIQQNRHLDAAVDAKNVHTVTFVYTDGDNMWWHTQGGFVSSGAWFNYGKELGDDGLYHNPTRDHDMGWGIPATSADLMGPVLTYLYQVQTEHDEFIMALNGTGYTYVSRWEEAARKEMTQELANYMGRTDLRYMLILDDAAFNEEILSDYTEHDEIEGIFYVGFDVQAGRVLWTDGKPTVGCRKDLWYGYEGQYNEILSWLSRDTLSVDTSKTRSYSMYYVCAWNAYPEVVETLVSNLPDNVEVVLPSEFMDRMIANCKPEEE